MFWKIRDSGTETETGGEDEGKGSSRLILARGYSTFNAAQVDGYTIPTRTAAPVAERIEHAERFFAATGMQLRRDGSRAFSDHLREDEPTWLNFLYNRGSALTQRPRTAGKRCRA